MKPYFAICVLALIFASISCRKNRSVRSVDFMYLEQIVDKKPDSVYEQLKSIATGRLSEGDMAWYILLRTEAEDKLYIPHTTDSLILQAKAYYEKANDVQRLAKAHYLAGRVYADRKEWEKAMNEFLEARSLASKGENWGLRGRIEEYLGAINWGNNLYDNALSYYKEAYKYYKKENDTISIAYSLKGIGGLHYSLGNTDSSIFILEKALSLVENKEDERLKAELYRRLSFLARENEDYDKAYYYIQKAIACKDKSIYHAYVNLGQIFLLTENLDSAYYYLSKGLSQEADITEKCLANYYLSEWAYKKGLGDKAYEYKEKYEILADSIESYTDTEKVAQKQYNYNIETKDNQYQKEKRRQRKIILYIGLCSIIIILFLIMYIDKKQKKILEAESEKNFLKQTIAENENQIMKLEEKQRNNNQQEDHIKALIEDNHSMLVKINQINISRCKGNVYLKRFYENKKKLNQFEVLDWAKFEDNFDSIYPHFYIVLKQEYPLMSEQFVRLCMLSIMGVKTEQIANVMGLQTSTVSTYKQTIKKRFFSSEQKAQLEEYLLKILAKSL